MKQILMMMQEWIVKVAITLNVACIVISYACAVPYGIPIAMHWTIITHTDSHTHGCCVCSYIHEHMYT